MNRCAATGVSLLFSSFAFATPVDSGIGVPRIDPVSGLGTLHLAANEKPRKTQPTTATADGLSFTLKNGMITATGGPCTGPGLAKVSIGEGAFKEVKDGTFLQNYHLDGVMRSTGGYDIHVILSPNVDWNDTVRQNRREAEQLARNDPDRPDVEKEADVVECLARSQSQYAIAFNNWMKANLHLCKTCDAEPVKATVYNAKPKNSPQCPSTIVTDDSDTSTSTQYTWKLRPDVKPNPKALGELLEHLRSIRDCGENCGGTPEEFVDVAGETFLSLAGEASIRNNPGTEGSSAVPFIKLVSCELGVPYR
jgi:hypothetical protein